jgi:hypothetical protein
MATTNQYSTPLSLCKHIGIVATIPSLTSNTKENVGTGDDSNATFWLDKLGVIEDTYNLYYGTSEADATALTETTHYTIDLDTSKITLTAAGIALVSTNNIYAAYSYNTLELLNSEMLRALNAAEDKVNKVTEQVFADATDTNPAYRKITNEMIQGHYNPYDKVFDCFFNPLVDFETTVNGAYTTGGTEIVLTTAIGLPESGTLYIGGNKVAYTGKSTNTLTIPATTPSIADGAVVRAEVIELSMEPEGNDPSYTVLTPNTDYKVDFMQGRVKLLANAYWGEIEAEDRLYPSNYLVRVNYMQAWREDGKDPEIPDEIEEVVNMIASKKFVQRMIKKAHTTGMNDFNPSALDSGNDEIERILSYYKPLNVGTSQYNKQFIS